MRIISGIAKSRRLKSLPNASTRPTADRVKESIFNILMNHLEDVEVLDLFAGTGNLGLEALSRGASKATFVESRKECIQLIRENIVSLGFEKESQIVMGPLPDILKQVAMSPTIYDLIFIDPPYSMGHEIPVLQGIHENNLLKPDGIIILEHHKKTIVEESQIPFTGIRNEKYGDTMITFYKYPLQKG